MSFRLLLAATLALVALGWSAPASAQAGGRRPGRKVAAPPLPPPPPGATDETTEDDGEEEETEDDASSAPVTATPKTKTKTKAGASLTWGSAREKDEDADEDEEDETSSAGTRVRWGNKRKNAESGGGASDVLGGLGLDGALVGDLMSGAPELGGAIGGLAPPGDASHDFELVPFFRLHPGDSVGAGALIGYAFTGYLTLGAFFDLDLDAPTPGGGGFARGYWPLFDGLLSIGVTLKGGVWGDNFDYRFTLGPDITVGTDAFSVYASTAFPLLARNGSLGLISGVRLAF